MIVAMTPENVLTLVPEYLGRCDPAGFPFKVIPDRLACKLASFIEAGLGIGWLSIDDGGLPDGMFFGIIMESIFSDDMTAQELFWQVLPGSRKRGVGMKLFRAFVNEAKQRGCTEILSGYQLTSQNRFLARLYRGLGYKLVALGFKKVI